MEEVINSIAMIVLFGLVSISSVFILLFVIGYYVFFDPKATTAGKLLFRFMLSLSGLVLLSFVGSLTGATRDTTWILLVAIVVYGYLAFTIVSLAVFLYFRKWKPERVKKKADYNLVLPRHTNEIPVIGPVFGSKQ